MATPYRGSLPSWDRRRHLLKRAEELIATGLSPFDVDDLARLDAAKAETPGALLATWLDQNTWREVLDEQRAKQNAAGARRRGRAAQAEGAPATEPVPVGAAIDGVLPAAPAKEAGDG